MAPPPRLTLSEWADTYRFLSAEASAEPGRWQTSRAEYQRGILDAISDARVETVVVMSSAQVGKTEIVNNLCGYHIHQDPAPLLIIQPTTEMGESWSKDRLAPMLRDSPALRGRVSETKAKSSGNTIRQKKFPGGHLAISGANSAAGLASRPIRVLCCDEIDRYPASAGAEGDPVSLGRRRTNNFWNRKIVLVSTPTTAGVSRIEAAYEESDRRQFWVPCPHCGHHQVLGWPSVRWPEGRPSEAMYHCEDCGAGWSDVQRWAAVRNGEWRARGEFRGIAGFHLNELYSPWRRLTETVADFLEAKKRPETFKTWVNTSLGETWQEQGEAPDWARLYERREPAEPGIVPAGPLVLTAAVDVQQAPERLEFALWGWGPGLESWLVEHVVIPGSATAPEHWDKVAALVDREWPCADGTTMKVGRCAVDTGGHATAGVYTQLRRLNHPRILPIKGMPGWKRDALVTGPTHQDVTERGRKIKRGIKLWAVSVDVLKQDFYRRLHLAREGEDFPPGWVHLPDWMDSEQVQQLVAEQLHTINDRRGFGRREWRKMRANEQLDLAVYARAALVVMGADRHGERFWERLAGERGMALPRPVEAPEAPVEAVVAAAAQVHRTTPAPRPRWRAQGTW
jgi:phage terminase large subunit GpA-like protein